MAVALHAWTSLADTKTFLGISGSGDDTLLESLIDSCTDFLEKRLGGRRIVIPSSDYVEIYDGDLERDGKRYLTLDQWPITTLTSVEYNSGTPSAKVWNTENANNYERYDEEGQLFYYGGLPITRRGIRITYSAGLAANTAAVPTDLRLACQKMVGKEYQKRKAQGETSESVGSASTSWSLHLDPIIEDALKPYRRFMR